MRGSMTMLSTETVIRCSDPKVAAIAEKVHRGERLTCGDGLALYETPDLWSVLDLANLVRRRMHGNVA